MKEQQTIEEKALAITDKRRNAISSREKVVKNLQWSGKLTAEEKAVLYHATKVYGLDPALREVLILGGNMYITISGRIRIAERSGDYAGCKFERLDLIEPDEPRYKCTVKKLMRQSNGEIIIAEFEGIGRASKHNVGSNIVREQWLDEMAQKRALGRALSNAWPVSIPTWEEAGLEEKYAVALTSEMIADLENDNKSEAIDD